LSTSSTKTFSYPDNPGLGRANLPNLPVLYTSDNTHTAIFEKINSAPEEFIGQCFYVSEWRLKPQTTMNTIMLLYGIVEPDHFYYDIAQSMFDRFQKMMKGYSKGGRKSLAYIMRSLGQIFKLDKYHLSSSLANYWLYSDRAEPIAHVDCLIYPSVRKDKSSVNFAFHPEFVEHQMYITSLTKIELTGILKHGANISLKEIGIISAQNVQWNKAHFTFKQVDLLDKDANSIHTFNQEEIYENTFGFDSEEQFRLPDKMISILGEKIQKDLISTLIQKSHNPKPYLIKFDQETEFEGMKAIALGCIIEYLYENAT